MGGKRASSLQPAAKSKAPKREAKSKPKAKAKAAPTAVDVDKSEQPKEKDPKEKKDPPILWQYPSREEKELGFKALFGSVPVPSRPRPEPSAPTSQSAPLPTSPAPITASASAASIPSVKTLADLLGIGSCDAVKPMVLSFVDESVAMCEEAKGHPMFPVFLNHMKGKVEPDWVFAGSDAHADILDFASWYWEHGDSDYYNYHYQNHYYYFYLLLILHNLNYICYYIFD